MKKTIKKYQAGGNTGKSKKYIDEADKNLTESIGPFNIYDMLKRQRAAKKKEEETRKTRLKYPAADNTRVANIKPPGFKKGGSVKSKKK